MISNHLLHQLQKTIYLHFARFYATKYFKKLAREMLIEQNIKFELKGAWAPGRTCTPKTGYFQDKTKISKANLRVNYYLLLKLLQ